MAQHRYFHREIEALKKTILEMGTLVEDRLRRACALLNTQDEEQAQAIIRGDWEIDEMEIRVEEDCLKILALHQPVARDLRLIVSIIKMNTELERIADIAANIAKRIITISRNRTSEYCLHLDYQPMALQVMEMVKVSLDALVTGDSDLARTVFLMDNEVNRLRDLAYATVIEAIGRDCRQSNNAAYLVNLYLIARHLERIGDRAINIAEEIIYQVDGEIVRSSEDAP